MATLNSIITPIHTRANYSIIVPFHNNLPSSFFTTVSKKIDRISVTSIPTNNNSNLVVSSKDDQPHSATDIVRRFYSGINCRDLSLVVDLIAQDCVYEDLVFPQPIVGRKAILEFFEKFIYTISQDLQFAIDDISGEDTSAVGVTWHLEWKGKPFPFSKGCSFYRLKVLDGRRQIIYGRDIVEPAVKPGDFALNGTLCIRLSAEVQSRRWRLRSDSSKFQMTLIDESLGRDQVVIKPSKILAYDLVQGPHVRWSYIADKRVPCPPTAVLLHGIIGSRKNWASITKKGPHTVASTAFDVLKLLGHLRVTPRVIIGHSFGGKVALSMVEQAAKPLARPVRVWILDATPGKVRAGRDGDDHPAELITFLSAFPKEVVSKREVIKALVHEGFSNDVAQWVVTNLRQINPSNSSSGFSWIFDLDGISECINLMKTQTYGMWWKMYLEVYM